MKGTIKIYHVCNDCIRKACISTKYPADSGVKSLYCECCGHFGIGSRMYCEIGDWLSVIPKRYVEG